MKKYVGTKHIEAEPMLMQEAYDKGLLQAGRMPVENKLGYIVKYNDGYLSWSPKDAFEAAYEVEETPLDRLYIERKGLIEKFQKLCTFIGRKDFNDIIEDEEMRVLLRLQQHYMGEYLNILNIHIKIMMKQAEETAENK